MSDTVGFHIWQVTGSEDELLDFHVVDGVLGVVSPLHWSGDTCTFQVPYPAREAALASARAAGVCVQESVEGVEGHPNSYWPVLIAGARGQRWTCPAASERSPL